MPTNRILSIFLFHLVRRIVSRFSLPVVIVLAVLVIAAMYAVAHFYGARSLRPASAQVANFGQHCRRHDK